MIPDSEGRMKINCSCLQLRIGDFAESSQESEGFADYSRSLFIGQGR